MDIRLSDSPRGPLKGIRIIDITTMITGPLCSQQLGDLGADVIKVEPLHGEVSRWLVPPHKAGLSGFYSSISPRYSKRMTSYKSHSRGSNRPYVRCLIRRR